MAISNKMSDELRPLPVTGAPNSNVSPPVTERKRPGRALTNLVKKLLHHSSGTGDGSLLVQARRTEIILSSAVPASKPLPTSWTEIIQDPVLWADLRDTIIDE